MKKDRLIDMFNINLGRGRSTGVNQLTRALIKEMIRSQVMMKATLKRVEEVRSEIKKEPFETQRVEELLERINEKTDRDFELFLNRLSRRG